ncbi:LPP20 family lipoprotein [Paraneptunicella aestuarii]|uniref:LPP20 family lipoprotein n=1 Tax=Paraneptunicella aestuarii TaxID=2831148 RepID=UPI001E59F211|nr:LPP20 family lipoprotein [Paraneptunicella aestuarii]UAA39467.1 LPP20 family lipoprotein [Paraneptunicella aestuarii]
MNAKVCLLVGLLGLSGCSTVFDKQVEWEYVEPESYPVLTAVGYAPVSAQPGESDSIKMLMAIKASKLDAYRELTEQVYGQKIGGNQSLANLVMTDTNLKSTVQGIIRGAEVVKTYPVGEDTYATELSLDFRKVYDIYISTSRPRRIKDVTYF